MLQMLIKRSGGSLRKLTVFGLGLKNNDIFSFIAENAGSLETLRLPCSEISDLVIEQTAWRLSMVTFLDLSYCNKIGAGALLIIGKNCKMLSALCRNMAPMNSLSKSSSEDEAHAIASSMPRLKRLEIAYQFINTESLLQILSSCSDLEFVDLRGCWSVILSPHFLKERYPKLTVLGPVVVDKYKYDEYDDHDRDEFSYFSDSSDYLEWDSMAGEVDEYYEDDDDELDEMWDDEGRLDEFQLRFYHVIGLGAQFYEWPQSP
ncbi:hypothetical protein SAY86_028220 [Trapa natans]|uniref:Uncharacterized protein n=1 Tax=Trapa natans TaxID=22666 RepID=A0AAN7M0A6_TRANT|nr:hypothetical protein SAY86_028220 [Trapa natans]